MRSAFWRATFRGSSPRRRGTPSAESGESSARRFIPAQAGNTLPGQSWSCETTVHPRAGGEHLAGASAVDPVPGSSPRRRGTLGRPMQVAAVIRFIPAQAGNTDFCFVHVDLASVHPRAGGEHRIVSGGCVNASGSSPRRRGTRRLHRPRRPGRRFIPAQAGNTGRRSRSLR